MVRVSGECMPPRCCVCASPLPPCAAVWAPDSGGSQPRPGKAGPPIDTAMLASTDPICTLRLYSLLSHTYCCELPLQFVHTLAGSSATRRSSCPCFSITEREDFCVRARSASLPAEQRYLAREDGASYLGRGPWPKALCRLCGFGGRRRRAASAAKSGSTLLCANCFDSAATLCVPARAYKHQYADVRTTIVTFNIFLSSRPRAADLQCNRRLLNPCVPAHTTLQSLHLFTAPLSALSTEPGSRGPLLTAAW